MGLSSSQEKALSTLRAEVVTRSSAPHLDSSLDHLSQEK